jgi:DNA-binding NarL/FixJ family response regulator
MCDPNIRPSVGYPMPQIESSMTQSGHTMTAIVLLVDDSKLARIGAAKAIRALQPDWVLLEASSAEEALVVFNSRDVHVAVLDFNMPDRTGLELAAELRQKYPDMPIAVATANMQDEIVAGVRAVNATFVCKPVTEVAMRGFVSGAALRLKLGSH